MASASQRSIEMPASPIRRLVPYAVAAESRGLHVHYLNIGQPDVASPDAFWEGMKCAIVRTLAYAPSPGIDALRTAAIEDYARRGIPVEKSQLLVTMGGSEATLFAFLSCFNPGDEVIVVEPYYANYSGFAVEAGIHLKAITTRIEDDFALPAIATIEEAVTPNTKGILVCNPSNPTGTALSQNQLDSLVELAIRKDLYLIADEVYRDFSYTGRAPRSIMTYPELGPRAVMIDSLSKRYSLCGARVGFLVARDEAVMTGATKFAQARLAVATIEQEASAAALTNTPLSYFDEMRSEYMTRRDVLVEELANIEGVVCPKIDGAFYALVELPVDDVEKFCIWMLEEFSFAGETVLLAPGEGFYLTPGKGKDQARIAYVLDEAQLRRAMTCLREGLKVYPGKRSLAGASAGEQR